MERKITLDEDAQKLFLEPRAGHRHRGEDFCRKPSLATFMDRNALILSSVILCKYNKELHNDIELTPEEVHPVRDGRRPAKDIL